MLGFIFSIGGRGLLDGVNAPVCGRSRPVVMTLAKETKETGGNAGRTSRRRSSSEQNSRRKDAMRKRKHMERRLEVQHEPETKLVVMLDYLRGLGLSMEDCGRVVQRRPQLLDLDIEQKIEPILRLLHAEPYHMNEKQVAKTIRNAPQIFFKSKKLFSSRLEFLKEVGVADSDLASIVSSRPHTLWMDLQNGRQVVEWMKNYLGVKEKNIVAKFVVAVPQMLLESPDRLCKTVDWFEHELDLDRNTCAQISEKWPLIFAYNPETTLLKRVKFLLDAGLSKETVSKAVAANPNITAMSIPAQLQVQLNALKDLKIARKDYDRIVSQVPTFFTTSVQSRVDFLLSTGLDKAGVGTIIKSQPAILFYSVSSNLKPKWEYLSGTMGGSVQDLTDLPTFFGLNLEERIMPRFAFCCSRSIKASVRDMVGATDESFCKKVAKVPYEEYRQFEQLGEWILFSTPMSF